LKTLKASGKAKAEYEDLADKAGSAKQKTRELLSAIHEGDADDKDLRKAIKEASKAIDHLKSFMKK
jgi:predicted  nucleic acid-binding Zn-ribbon protein